MSQAAESPTDFDTLFVTGGGMLRDEEEDLTDQRLGVWEIRRLIARGGMANVYEAERCDGVLRQRAAIKVLNRRAVSQESSFRQEQQILADLSHPGIARILDVGLGAKGRSYLVMDYVEGKPIDVYCADHELSLVRRVELLEDVARALEYAHDRGVYHHDVKPANVLIDGAGHPRLIDFGIASVAGMGTDADPLLTPRYAAPEQFEGQTEGAATDVFQFGLLSATVLLGRYPASASDPREAASRLGTSRIAGLDGPLGELLFRCLQSDPKKRPDSIKDVRARLTKWRSRHERPARRWAMGLSVLGFVALGTITAWLYLAGEEQKQRAAATEDLVSEVLNAGAAGEDVISSSSFELSEGSLAHDPKLQSRLTAITAKGLLRSGRPGEVVRLIESVLGHANSEQGGAQSDLYLLLAEAHLMLAQTGQAQSILQRVTSDSSQRAELEALAYWLMGRPSQAAASLAHDTTAARTHAVAIKALTAGAGFSCSERASWLPVSWLPIFDFLCAPDSA